MCSAANISKAEQVRSGSVKRTDASDLKNESSENEVSVSDHSFDET